MTHPPSKLKPGAFDKFPRWLAKSKDFKKLGGLEVKLLVYFAHVRKWDSNMTPWTTMQDLAEVLGARWKRTIQALHTLAEMGAVRVERSKRRTRIRLMFSDSYTSNDSRTDSRATTVGKTRCSPRGLEGRFSTEIWSKRDDYMLQTGRQVRMKTCRTGQRSMSLWVYQARGRTRPERTRN